MPPKQHLQKFDKNLRNGVLVQNEFSFVVVFMWSFCYCFGALGVVLMVCQCMGSDRWSRWWAGELLCCWHSVSLDHLGWYSHISAAFLVNFPSDFEDISSVFEVLQFSRSLWDEELKLRHWLWLLWLLVMDLFAALCSCHVWWRKILSEHCLNPLKKHRNGSLVSLVHDVKLLLPCSWTLRVKSLKRLF